MIQDCVTETEPYDHDCHDFETVGIECSGDGSLCIGPTAVYIEPPYVFEFWSPEGVVLVAIGVCVLFCACWPGECAGNGDKGLLWLVCVAGAFLQAFSCN